MCARASYIIQAALKNEQKLKEIIIIKLVTLKLFKIDKKIEVASL